MKKEQERRQQVFLSLPQPQYSLEDNKKQIIQSLNLGTDAITDGTTDVEALVRKIKALKDGSSLGGKKE